MKNRYALTALAAVLSASLLCSCSSEKGTDAAADSTAETAAIAEPIPAEGEAPAEMPADMPEGAPGEMPADMQGGPQGEMPADMQGGPQGEMPAGERTDGERPEGAPGEMPEGGPGGMSGGMPGGMPGGGSSAPESYDSVLTLDGSEDTSSVTEIESTGTDESAVLVEGASASLDGVTISRVSADSTGGDASSFYGTGAAVLVTDGELTLSNADITTDAKGGAGVFAYGTGTVYVSDSVISTAQSTSGGIHAAGGGTLYAWDLNVTTEGESSAAIRSDRGGGTMVVEGGSYTSNGQGSPAIYSTADITVADAALTATGSEAICIEGDNTIRLYNCDLTGSMADLEQNGLTWNVILYQSMSGDSEVGNSVFTMDGGSLTAENGGMFYSTNTQSTFVLHDVDLVMAEDAEFLLRVTGNSNARGWGSAGANGADTVFTAIDQEMTGDVTWDSISTLSFYMENAALTGAFLNDESDAGNGGDGYADLYIDAGSTWVVTKDSVLSSLHSLGSIVDAEGKTVSIVGTDGTVYVEGESALTVTVGSYDSSCDLSGAGTIEDYAAYRVEKNA